QGYVVLLPVASAVATRRLPELRVVVCALLVLAGLAVLAGGGPRSRAVALGRGEGETLGAAAGFTLPILLLGLRRFAATRAAPVAHVMFAVITLVMLPVLAAAGGPAPDFAAVFAMPLSSWYFAVMVVFPTIGSFLLMNRYQRRVTASEAGIVYAMEPVFA